MSAAAGLDVEGPGAPPRDNGELAFTAPWQARTFGMTMALVDVGALDWERFRAALVQEVAAQHAPERGYWGCWARALERLLVGRGLLPVDAVTRLASHLAVRPAGHDHPAGERHGHRP